MLLWRTIRLKTSAAEAEIVLEEMRPFHRAGCTSQTLLSICRSAGECLHLLHCNPTGGHGVKCGASTSCSISLLQV